MNQEKSVQLGLKYRLMLNKGFELRKAEVFDLRQVRRLACSAGFGLSRSKLKLFMEDEGTNFTVLRFEEELAGFSMSGSFVCGEVTLMYFLPTLVSYILIPPYARAKSDIIALIILSTPSETVSPFVTEIII